MKNFLTILILTLGLVFVSCANKPPEPPTLKPDSEATNVGNSTKTPNYKFTDGFTYHEWKGESPKIISIPFENSFKSDWWRPASFYNTNAKHPVKKLVTSKYFDIYVDITEGGNDFRIATNMTDVAYDKLIRELEKYYHKIKSVYGEPSNIDGNGKIEIVFHNKYLIKKGASGYFNYHNIMKEYWYTAEMDILYISSGYFNEKKEFQPNCVKTIFHEFQHDVFAYNHFNRIGYKDISGLRWINEALSESTYIVLYNGEKGSGRDSINNNGKRQAYFNTDAIRNGQYFFNWSSGYLESDNYRTAANFMYWLYIHGGGNQIIRDIIFLNSYKSVDIKSVGKAARKNIPALKGMSDADIVKTWYAANVLNKPNSIYGYKEKTKIITAKANNRDGNVLLNLYCAVYTTRDMYSHNSYKKGLNIAYVGDRDDLLIFNAYYYKPSIKIPFYNWWSALVRINPNVIDTDIPNFHMISSFESQEEEWFDYAFMYGEETTLDDFMTKEERERKEKEIIKELERAEIEENIIDDFKVELEIIE